MTSNAKVTPLPGRIPQWSFDDRIRKVRRQLGYTQDEMADALEVGLKAYSAWEAGKNTPSDILSVAQKLERVTGVPRQWFIGWMDDEPGRPDAPSGSEAKITFRSFASAEGRDAIVTDLSSRWSA